jgi:hypothetical protein
VPLTPQQKRTVAALQAEARRRPETNLMIEERQAPARDETAAPAAEPKEPSLFDGLAIASREDGKDMQLLTRETALADADRTEMHADLFASCKD